MLHVCVFTYTLYTHTSSLAQVQRMTGYAVGEMMKPLKQSEGTEEGEESSRWKPNTPDHCYEVVTAWVHPW